MSAHDPHKMIPLTPVSDESATESASGVDRRTVLQTLISGVGAGLALPAVVQAQHPVQQHVGTATAAAAQK